MTPLLSEIRSRIEAEGPLSIADYMALCLTHGDHGYYTTSHPVGGRASASRIGGDFITAPEVSQMFGEMISVWCMEVWQALGCPSPFTLAEFGPGRGTLMADLLRVAKAMPGFLDAAKIHLVEISPTLAEQQSLALSKPPSPVCWIRDISGLPDQPTIVIANEFLDALPFRQWVRQKNSWLERGVGWGDGTLHFVTRPSLLSADVLPPGAEGQPDGTIFETSAPRQNFIATLAEHIAINSGAALFVDYGHIRTGFGDTFQAVRDHGYVSALEAPGTADLTSHVDFEPLRYAASQAGCVVKGPVTQGEFLLALGLVERAGSLGQGRSDDLQDTLRQAVEKLAGAGGMGTLFKAMAFGAPASLENRLPGF